MKVEMRDSLQYNFFLLKHSQFLSKQTFPLQGNVINFNFEDGTVVHNAWLTCILRAIGVTEKVTKSSLRSFDAEFSQNIKL